MNGNNVYNYMNNMSIENNSYTYISNKNRTKFGKNVVNFIRTKGCDPDKIFSKITNKNNKGGFHLRKIRSTRPIRYSLNKKIAKSGKGTGILASGSTGDVYIGCLDKSCKKEVAIKEVDKYEKVKVEYDITNKLVSLSPHITKVYAVNECNYDRGLLYSEYYSGNSIEDWVMSRSAHMRPIYIRNMIFQVLYTLRRIQQKYPKFRHNDLHTQNVLVNDRAIAKGYIKYTIDGAAYYVKNAGVSASIADFGLSDMPGIRNPEINSKNMKNEWGLGPRSHPLYDAHLFLNSVYGIVLVVPSLSATKKFIESVLPLEYLGENSNQIQKFRLRYGNRHPGLPTIRKILKHPYFASIMSKKMAFMNSYPQTAKSPPLSKKGRAVKKMNTINEGKTPSPPKKRTVVRRPVPVPVPKAKTPSPPKPQSPVGLSRKNMVKFIITNGTKKAQMNLTRVFVPGEKLPTRDELLNIVASFAKGQKLLELPKPKRPPRQPAARKPRAPQVAPAPPSKNSRPRYPATFANIRRMTVKRGKRSKVVSPAKRKPVSPATKRYNNALLKGEGPSWLLEENLGLIGRARPKPKTPSPKKNLPRAYKPIVKFINFSKRKSKATGSIRTVVTRVIPNKNRVILNAADKRRVQALREQISNNLANTISNFANREKKAYAMALVQVENQKRKFINIGLINEPVRRVINQAVVKASSPIKKITTNKKVMPPSVQTKFGKVGGHTGKVAKMLTGIQAARRVPPPSNYSLNKDNRLKIKGKLCSGYKKDELQDYLKKSGITFTQKATKEEMCNQLKKNVFK